MNKEQREKAKQTRKDHRAALTIVATKPVVSARRKAYVESMERRLFSEGGYSG